MELKESLDPAVAALAKTLDRVEAAKTTLHEKDAEVTAAVTATHENMGKLVAEIEAVGKELETQRASLQTELAAVTESAETASTSLGEIKEHLTELSGQLDTAAESVETNLEAFETHLTESLEKVATSLESLKEKAASLAEEVNQASTEAGEFLKGDFDSSIQEIKTSIEAKATALSTQISTDVLPKLTKKTLDFENQIKAAVEKLAQANKSTSEQLAADGKASVDRAHQGFNADAVDPIDRAKDSARDTAGKSATLVSDIGKQVGESSKTLSDSAESANAGMESVIEILNELKETFEKVTHL